jgi:hypothetical protein
VERDLDLVQFGPGTIDITSKFTAVESTLLRPGVDPVDVARHTPEIAAKTRISAVIMQLPAHMSAHSVELIDVIAKPVPPRPRPSEVTFPRIITRGNRSSQKNEREKRRDE